MCFGIKLCHFLINVFYPRLGIERFIQQLRHFADLHLA
ncbi:hypothetical protein EDP2_3958 [Enterobacter cloacae S611]|uniref:Transposase n=1 Tax=Enterobacter cloacae S611 TaxID=1399146 RepID=A0ABP2ZRY4_ENTCL|nr:hypothetical protein EDP2_3958 [Enterobacter cloacae S611]